VGVTGVEKVVRIRDELFLARLDCYVDLGHDQKGAHMSRFDEVVNQAIGEVRAERVAVPGGDARAAHRGAGARAPGCGARRGHDRGPLSRAQASAGVRHPEPRRSTRCTVERSLSSNGTRGTVGVSATGMTACPCAQELVAARARERLAAQDFSAEQIDQILQSVPVATHNQRGLASCRSAAPSSARPRSTQPRCWRSQRRACPRRSTS